MLFKSGFANFEPRSVKRNVSTSVWMVCTIFTIISNFEYYTSQIMVAVERECSKPAENRQTLITNCPQETLVLTQITKNDENIKIFWKHPYWPWQMTFLFFDILNTFLASYCIFVQIRKYLWWREDKSLLQNGSATRKSQVAWPLTFCLKEQYASSFYCWRFNYKVRSLNTQHFHGYCCYKNVLFMG